MPDKGFDFDAEGQPLINFDVDGALRNGHSKLAIAKYLCELRKLDFTELQSRGLSNDAIIAMLAYPKPDEPEPTPKPSYNSEGFEG